MSVPKPNPFLAPSEPNVCRTRVITTDLGGGYAADKALVACSARSEVLRGHHNDLQTFRPNGASGCIVVRCYLKHFAPMGLLDLLPSPPGTNPFRAPGQLAFRVADPCEI